MAMLLSRRAKSFLCRLQPFLHLERFKCSFVEDSGRAQLSSKTDGSSCSGEVEVSKWRKLNSRDFGISREKISTPSWTVLKMLRNAGFDAFLVGGCVRDLILNKIPKDFDVITTAGLDQVKRKFSHAIKIGRRFPICLVTVKGTKIEVSSFDTLAKVSKRRKGDIYQIPKGCDPGDFVRWKNCMSRDFTVNSLFFDPFENVIFDYTNAMRDLRSLKLRTIMPANLSFKEDQARILRGLRLAARLNLSFSKETEDALCSLSSSVAALSKSRINMEMNYMLSYGAAGPSLLLLKRFKLLEILLPFHAAYLSEQVDNGSRVGSLMLMKLFFNLDQLITCDQPCTESLWVAILAFHMAICTNPQHHDVVLTLAVLLCHRTWEESIRIARKQTLTTRVYIPEILDVPDHLSDDEIVKRVTNFAGHVANSVDILMKNDCLLESMRRFPKFPCSGLFFVSRVTAKRVKHIFNITADTVDSVKPDKRSKDIDYRLLSKGDEGEIKFVLGKVIFRTLVQSKNLAEKEATKDGKDDRQVTNLRQNSKALHQKTQPESAGPGKSLRSTKRKSLRSTKLAEKEATKDGKDDTQVTNVRQNSKALDQKTQPESAGPGKSLRSTKLAEKKATKDEKDDAQVMNPSQNLKVLFHKTRPKSAGRRKRLPSKKEATKDDTQLMNPPQNLKVLDQKTQPKSGGPVKPPNTGRNAKKTSKTPSDHKAANGIATDQRLSGEPGSLGKISKDEPVNNKTSHNRHVLSGLFK